jgi:hypothetical protein
VIAPLTLDAAQKLPVLTGRYASRYRYITFDHLMSIEELQASYDFQGSTDLILNPCHTWTDFADWRIGGCTDPAQRWVNRHFFLDYSLNSLEKTLDGPPANASEPPGPSRSAPRR